MKDGVANKWNLIYNYNYSKLAIIVIIIFSGKHVDTSM